MYIEAPADLDVEDQVGAGKGMMALGVMPALGKLSGLWFSGEVSIDEACSVSPLELKS